MSDTNVMSPTVTRSCIRTIAHGVRRGFGCLARVFCCRRVRPAATSAMLTKEMLSDSGVGRENVPIHQRKATSVISSSMKGYILLAALGALGGSLMTYSVLSKGLGIDFPMLIRNGDQGEIKTMFEIALLSAVLGAGFLVGMLGCLNVCIDVCAESADDSGKGSKRNRSQSFALAAYPRTRYPLRTNSNTYRGTFPLVQAAARMMSPSAPAAPGSRVVSGFGGTSRR